MTTRCGASQVLKTERGLGLDQPAMWAAEERLSAGDWVHIFPEGTRSKNGGKSIGKVRCAAQHSRCSPILFQWSCS